MLAVVRCGVYPLAVFGVSQVLFPDKANGSLIVDSKGVIHGSKWLGQSFSGDKYFHPRPSAAGNGYDPTSTGGSNLGPTSKKLADSISQNLSDYRSQNGLATNATVPADAVTASGSGLDPHISPANADIQAARVAKVRGMKADEVRALVTQYTDHPSFRFPGRCGRECAAPEPCARRSEINGNRGDGRLAPGFPASGSSALARERRLHFNRCGRTRQMDYQIEFLPSALEQIRALPKDDRRLIGAKFDRA